MKTINTLISDIYSLVRSKQEGWFNEQLSQELSADLASRLSIQLGSNTRKPTLRLSGMGERCPSALWHSIHHPELAEALPPWAEIKFAFGHVTEALAITLAKAAGHTVTGEQDELVLDGIVGHRDCIIDGHVVDVKSASSISFQKFKSKVFEDTFGYLDQLDGYVLASREDPLVTVKDKSYLLVVDKQLGHMVLYEHRTTPEREARLRARIAEYKRIVALPVPPSCECGLIREENGNVRLDLKASYSAFKHCCHPHLRTFLYAGGPRYFTKVVKQPWNKDGPIKEIDRYGKTIY